MKFILAQKQKMTQLFKDNGKVIPVTIVKAGPVVVVRNKIKNKDGYSAVVVGFGNKKHASKPLAGQLKNLKPVRARKEFKINDESESEQWHIGDEIKADIFQEGDKVIVKGVSKGKGFSGMVKRYKAHGNDTTHGTKNSVRTPGSIGATGIQRVLKGHKMPGRGGGKKFTLKKIAIVKVDTENNLLYLKGAVHGAKESLLILSQV